MNKDGGTTAPSTKEGPRSFSPTCEELPVSSFHGAGRASDLALLYSRSFCLGTVDTSVSQCFAVLGLSALPEEEFVGITKRIRDLIMSHHLRGP